ncbi:MAG: proline iminopeptidase-family hydrolase [Gammaproteobacteria bacterium]
MFEKTGNIKVTGGKVAYKIFYTKENKEKPPLLVIHGGPGVPHDYLLSLSQLAILQPIIFYDQLGCGASEHPENDTLWKIERFVEEVQILCTSLKIKKLHIYGHSFGAAVGLEYAFSHPNNVISLIMASPLISTEIHTQDTMALLDYMPKEFSETIKHYEARKQFTHEKYLAAKQQYVEMFLCRLKPFPKILTMALSKANSSLMHKMFGPCPRVCDGTLKGYNNINKLTQIKAPTLITTGEFDFPRPATLKHYIANTKNFQLNEFPGCSHTPHLEDQEKYLALLKNYLTLP